MNNCLDFTREDTVQAAHCEYRVTLYNNGCWDANFDFSGIQSGFQNFAGTWITVPTLDTRNTLLTLKLNNAIVNGKYVTNERPPEYQCLMEGNFRRPYRITIQPELSIGSSFGILEYDPLERLETGIESLGQ
jgi:hypothetical protein